MGMNIELKIRCKEHTTVEEIMENMNFPFEGVEHQTDTFFLVPNGRLKLREYNNGSAKLIPYLRPDISAPRSSDYVLLDVTEISQTKNILKHMFGMRSVINKKRKIYHYDNIRIHLDEVENLGLFMELEGVITKPEQREDTLKKIELLTKIFEIKDEDVVINAYIDLLEKMGLGS